MRDMTTHDLIHQYFAAMQAGPDGEAALLALFTDDIVYIEPFSGVAREHRGKAAVRAALRAGWQQTPPDLTLTVERIDLDGDVVRSRWQCVAPALPGPVRGADHYTIRDGRIARLEVTLEPWG